MKSFSRPLVDDSAIESFLTKCLDINSIADQYKFDVYEQDAIEKISTKIRDVEAAVANTDSRDTLDSKNCRRGTYRDDGVRDSLRRKIVSELIEQERLERDDDIALGRGGAKPIATSPRADKQAYFFTGLPASGKSSLVNRTADKLGAYILDSDFAKRKLPEYDSPAGANLVHREASKIVFGGSKAAPCLSKFCIFNGFNIVLPKVGSDYDELIEEREALRKEGYSVHLTTTIIPRQLATFRAFQRFEQTGRYVPLSLVFDGYANDPNLTYYRAMTETLLGEDAGWASLAAVCTLESQPRLIGKYGVDNPAELLDGGAK